MKFIAARNYTRVGKRDVGLIVIHTMEYPERPDGAEWCAKYFAGPNAPEASAHYYVDADSVVQGVRDEDVAWAAPGANHNGIQPTPLWSGDYETGDWSQWESVPMTGPVSKSIVTSGAAQGLRAARFESGPSTSSTRVELQRDVVAYDEAMTLEWDQYVPSTTKFAAHGSFNHLVQFHPWYDPCYGSSLAVNGLTSPARLILRMRGGQVSDTTGGCTYPTDRTYDLGPLPRDQWLHFVLAVRWSADPAVGYLSLKLNGQQMIAHTAQAVGFLGPNGERRAVHVRQGLYRFQSDVTTVVYGDGFRKYAS